jgi:DNA-directed RNA polymerase specialized sigma24 family protein
LGGGGGSVRDLAKTFDVSVAAIKAEVARQIKELKTPWSW